VKALIGAAVASDGKPFSERRNTTVRNLPQQHHFILGARNLQTHADSRSSAFSDKQNLKSLIAGFKPSSRNPMPVLQNWVYQGNKLSPSELRLISRTLIKSKRYNHTSEVPFFFTCLLYPYYATCVLQCSKVVICGQLLVFTI
jgi:hypothetical protein